MAYFECIVGNGGSSGTGIPLTVNCDANFAGTTISVSDGTTTLTAQCPSSSPYTVEFELPNVGTWTVSGTYSGQTFTSIVTVTAFEANLNATPEGATVTPTDDIQTWLHCANIWDKTYTTISQVLNDSATVTALIASSNAVDYMVRSTTWASSVCANSSAMTKIGANNYCADTLLDDNTWLNAICDSTYFESVLNVKVPTMTSATTPSGAVKTDSAGGDAYKAFDNTTACAYVYKSGSSNPINKYIAYTFTSSVKVRKMMLQNRPDSNSGSLQIYKVIASNNGGVIWTDLSSEITETDMTAAAKHYHTLNNQAAYTTYGLYCIQAYNDGVANIPAIQFYGRAAT